MIAVMKEMARKTLKLLVTQSPILKVSILAVDKGVEVLTT